MFAALVILCQGKLFGSLEYTLIAAVITFSLALALGMFLSEYLLYWYDHDDQAELILNSSFTKLILNSSLCVFLQI